MSETTSHGPDWELLYETASVQSGYFTTGQALEAGYSLPLLNHHINAGRFERARRGIYRLVHFPVGEHEELVVMWLWSEQQGVYSHVTALALHNLSDVLPSQLHMTLPTRWQQRRLRVPDGLVLYFADLDESERNWFEAVPVTAPGRTLRDCIEAHVSPELVRHAVAQARRRGLITPGDEAQLNAGLDAAPQGPA
ncbi:MAG: type IV toxin-antitoxin system AbiEi family antitoxin domain-containing protein [Bradymonadaceae bacterium]|nr:type IV toxin-antitoxin system AbiEi family antitoxin domain-containing protein [Lujinxingiaceae bacterium]